MCIYIHSPNANLPESIDIAGAEEVVDSPHNRHSVEEVHSSLADCKLISNPLKERKGALNPTGNSLAGVGTAEVLRHILPGIPDSLTFGIWNRFRRGRWIWNEFCRLLEAEGRSREKISA